MFRKREPVDELLLPSLPASYNDADKEWIQDVLTKMPRQTWAALCSEYSKIFNDKLNDETLPKVRRENVARKQANEWLRAKQRRYLEIMAKREANSILHAKSNLF